jgi:hypothetical protein
MRRGIVILLSVLGFGPGFAAATPDPIALLFGSMENVQLVRTADKVDACLLRHLEPTTRADGSVDRSTERYEETAFTPVPPTVATALRDLLLNEKTYDWAASSGGRRPQFYLRLRFQHGEETLAVDFCFGCHVLSVSRQGDEQGHANFGRNGDLFLRALLQVFPHDPPLQQVARESGLPP